MSDPENSPSDSNRRADANLVAIEDEVSSSYLDYAMSVIVSRALPDVRDGLKPVHRRILYTMHENGYTHDKPHRKCARIVGDVMGRYHPHGDQAIYDALIRLGQGFSLRLPLLDGQGNFGSIDGDPAAAMRYTEVRLGKPAESLLEDIEKDTVDFQDNYDGESQEPTVIPARFPNLLVNGAGGIAVGMATNIPPHNFSELVDGCIAIIDDPNVPSDRLNEIIQGPDFPTGGFILGKSGVRSAFESGRGAVIMRGRVHFEELAKDKNAIIITEIPYQVNKATMIEKIADLVRDKRIEGISDLRDESDRHGMRVVIELKREANRDVILNQLYRFSSLQTSFGVNMLALNGGRPELMNMREMLDAFIDFREVVVTRRTALELRKARARAHLLVGLAIAVSNLDDVILLIRTAKNPVTARERLLGRDWPAADIVPLVELIADPRHVVKDNRVRLSEEQARGILELRLQRLTALGRDEIGDELKELETRIDDYLDILRSRTRVMQLIKCELEAVKEEFGTPRRTEIVEADVDVEDEDLIQKEDMVVTVTHSGYIKRVPLNIYRTQRRGGKGRTGMATRDEDFVSRVFVANTHQPVLFFSSTGMVYRLKVWRLPQATPQSRGKAMVNLLPLNEGELITTVMPLPEDESQWSELDVMFATTKGNVRRNRLSDFIRINVNGKIAMKPTETEKIVGVQICSESDNVILTSANGRCIRFAVSDVRVFSGRTSTGVRGIKLGKDEELGEDEVIAMTIVRHVDATPAEARSYLRQANAIRRATAGEEREGEIVANAEEDNGDADKIALSAERYAELGAYEQFLLTVSENGFGKCTSAYEYRTSRRGGKGIIAMTVTKRNGKLVASFPVEIFDQIMLVTDAGQLIRCPVDDIRIAGRNTQGVTLFKLSSGERVVSVEHLGDAGRDDDRSEVDDE